ncbi:2-keto-4-pentenoate hydratase/2-oxohepta-3-ene-1,7-dioic acid hydratase (catechol pathway) [Amycolatopsis pretoriensis]|uniref:2-keto-4-pentenoate hydratase/2-oxohepta-3-ene-1,7-dioic acid hydratase (Catechol pathway) n=2 Tax=Amycolatopsis pretoriensis TaxID=218821 RepID=A0A1H5Q1V4_9PSEU|nr:fumarylacetoacetate hydrolase family protein [Amycolatopsis pretoriensis]SEF20036.1 2-keto-4-pentenoate hydratase/2-oxohepta-3-ene-1,7-dioic acid hydratase (catechol pathway) [Amycolatopsis pretoriensis]
MRIANLAGRLVLLTGDGAVDVERASGQRFPADPHAVYARWTEFTAWAAGLRDLDAEAFDETGLRAPSPTPAQVFGVGLNYRDHAAESGLGLPESPAVFTKFPSCLTGPSGDIALTGSTVDWEVELVAVIGREARNVPAERGWDHVAGLTIGQDLSDRTVQLAGPAPQFSLGKSAPGFGPTGPWLVTPDEFADRDNLELGCAVNGESVQKGRTSDLIFPVPEIVARLSAILPLRPGDVIFTGTPSGVGMARSPQRFLAAGDELATTIEGIGSMRHRFTEPS